MTKSCIYDLGRSVKQNKTEVKSQAKLWFIDHSAIISLNDESHSKVWNSILPKITYHRKSSYDWLGQCSYYSTCYIFLPPLPSLVLQANWTFFVLFFKKPIETLNWLFNLLTSRWQEKKQKPSPFHISWLPSTGCLDLESLWMLKSWSLKKRDKLESWVGL